MTTITFDTLKFANRLKEAGVPDKHAEAEAEALSEVFEVNLQDVVTNQRLEKSKTELQESIAHLELRLVRWMIILAGLSIALIKLT